MKKLFVCLASLMVMTSGCDRPIDREPVNCPEKLGVETSNVQEIVLAGRPLSLTGSVKAGQNVGYSFQANVGQNLSFSSSDENICIQVFSPSIKQLENMELPEDGKYVIAIATPQGTRNYKLDISLTSPGASSIASPAANITENTVETGKFTMEQATELVDKWLKAKPKIFAHPYDRSLVASLTTGDRYDKASGSINWLKENKARYEYKVGTVEPVGNFNISGDRASATLRVTEDIVLYVNDRVNSKNTTYGPKTKVYIFNFRKDGSAWKIESVQSQ